jgi:ribosome-associated protein
MPDAVAEDNAAAAGNVLRITHDLVVPISELGFRFSRSSGPGGQHVNRSETRVELFFDVAHSPSLSDVQRARLLDRLDSHLDAEGTLHIFSSLTRSQLANREDAVARFQALLRAALRQRRHRLPTRPTAAGRERRLRAKRERSTIKQGRRAEIED